MTNQSQETKELFAAIAVMQTNLKSAKKTAENDYFKSNYADLESCWDAARSVLAANGLSVIQTMDHDQGSDFLVTTLAHESGQFIRGRLRLTPIKNDPQAMGSAITYARRYALAAVIGLTQADDDAESAMDRSGQNLQEPKKPTTTTPPRMATDAQCKMVWAKLKSKGAGDDEAKTFIVAHSGKHNSKDLTFADIDRLVKALETFKPKTPATTQGDFNDA